MTQPSESAARRNGSVFDEIAADYDRYRPAYPDELIGQATPSAHHQPGRWAITGETTPAAAHRH